jgi:hypothetical protein
MARFREKISPFVFGLSVGLLIGCGIFIFKLDDFFKNFRFSDNKKPEFEERVISPEEMGEKKEKHKKSSTVSAGKEKKAAKSDESGTSTLAVIDSSGFVPVTMASEENISVLKEELLGVKNIRVRIEADTKAMKKDSLAASVAGVADFASGDFMLIEFWKTPLNSKGYKMSRNKVVLYGVTEQNIDIVKLDDAFYLRNNQNVYRLNYTNEFHKMEKVSESAILARLN